MRDNNCIFCKIGSGNLPSKIIYEDELVSAFLDTNPVAKGHILVIPKEHYENIFETPPKVLERVSIICKDIALQCKKKLKATGVNILNASGKDAQQSVFHLHYHVVPRYCNDGLDLWFPHEPSMSADIETTYKQLKSKL